MHTIRIKTTARQQFIDITDDIRAHVRQSGVTSGIAVVFVPHTTAGITLNENWDDDVKTDMLLALERMVPDEGFRHSEGNSAAHAKAMITGASAQLIISGGDIALNSWQGIYFAEFDGPRQRKVNIEIIGQART
ncbi:MAG: secondary thiamine-phosphate synthase enzyme YjbQ [Christensenellales bacterium]|jgi:secondary thiamine-phosphate synthase enzyme